MKFFNKLWFLAFTLIIAFFFSNAYAKSSLVIGTDDWPPYEYKNGNNIVGYSTEVIEQVLKNMNIKIDSNTIFPWSRAEKLLFEGSIDALYSSSTSDKRQQFCHFPQEPLINSDWVLFIRTEDRNKLKFDSYDDLKGKKIGVVQDYSYTPEFWNFVKKENNYDKVSNDKTNFRKLMKKRFDYLVSEYAVGVSIAKELGFGDKVVAFTQNPIKSTGLYIMFSKKTVDKAFADQFSEQLKAFKQTPEYQKIYDKYMK